MDRERGEAITDDYSDLQEAKKYSRESDPKLIIWAVLGALLLLTMVLSVGIGRYSIPLSRVVGIIASRIVPLEVFWSSTDERVIMLIRTPRILLALFSGAGLALSGAALQGVFRNPLVGPQIIGVTTGSGFGGALGILFFGSQFMTMSFAFLFGLMSIALVYLISRSKGRSPVLMLVLSGVIASAFFNALTSLIKYVADPYDKLPAIVVWLMGSFSAASYQTFFITLMPISIAGIFLFLVRFRINIVSLGEEEAEAIGVHTDSIRWMILVAVTITTAAVVSVAGVIGWIGLVVPHIARMLVGPDHKKLLPASALIGGIYTIWIDNIARAATASEIPLGIITAIIGAPVFGYLLKKTHARGWKHD